MKIGLIQTPDKLNLVSDVDLVVLPEFWGTNFEINNIIEHTITEDVFLKPFIDWQTRHPNVIVCTGSMPIQRGEFRKNTAYLIYTHEDQQQIKSYEKLHLFKPLNEHILITPGNINLLRVHQVGNLRIAIVLCYDLRFSRIFDLILRPLKPDIIIVPAQWPLERINLFRDFLRVRAAETGSIVIGVNKICLSFCFGPGNDDLFYNESVHDPGTIKFDIDLNCIEKSRKFLPIDCRI